MSLRFSHTDDLNNPAAFTEVFPLSDKKFEDKKEKNEVFYRRKFKGKYKFINDKSNNISDFDFFFAFESDKNERCRERFIIVEEKCNGNWSVLHRGKFSMNDGDFDLDKCEIELKVKEVDRYSCIKEKKSEKFNILSVAPIVSTIAPQDTPFEFIACRVCDVPTPSCYSGPNPTSWRKFYEECTDIIPGTGGETSIKDIDDTPYECDINDTHATYFIDRPAGAFSDVDLFVYEIATATNTLIAGVNGGGGINSRKVSITETSGGFIAYSPVQTTNKVILYNIATTGSTTIYNPGTGTGSVSFLKIFNGKVAWIDTDVGGGLFMYDIGTATTKTVSLLTSIDTVNIDHNGTHLVYSEFASDELRIFEYSTAITTIIKTNAPINMLTLKILGNYVTFFDRNSRTFESYKISTSTLVVALLDLASDVVGSARINDLVSWNDRNSGKVYLYDLLTDTLTDTGEIEGDVNVESDIDMTVNYITYVSGTSNKVKYYDINTPSINLADTAPVGNSITRLVISSSETITYHIDGTSDIIRQFLIPLTIFASNITLTQNVDCMQKANNDLIVFVNRDGTGGNLDSRVSLITPAISNLTKIKIWFREIRTTLCIGGIPVQPIGAGWILEEDNCATLGTAKWVKVPPTIVSPNVQITPCICTPTVCSIPVPPAFPGNWLKIADCTKADPRSFWWELPSDITYDRGRLLKDVIEGMLAELCPDINGIVSNFFQWNPTISSNINYVTGLTNQVNHITIHQKSDIRDPNSTEPATIGNLKWKELVQMMRIMFEVYWFIDDNDVVHFEHISIIQGVQGLDLTQGKFNDFQKNNRRYAYDKFEMFRLESFEHQEQENIDFVGHDIEYKDVNGDFSLCVNDEDKENKLDKFTTDLILAQNNPVAIDRTGFYLLANTFDGATYRVILSQGVITNQLIVNSPLSWANLQESFLKWNRILDEGVVNRVFQPLNLPQRFKKQDKFKIPLCCDDGYKPEDFMSTSLGDDAEIETGLRDFKTNTLEIKLKYQ